MIWANEKSPPSRVRWPVMSIPLHIIHQPGISQRFSPHPLIQTEAILSLDEDTLLTTDEIDFAFHVWTNFPDRIVGYPARSHYWDDAKVQYYLLFLISLILSVWALKDVFGFLITSFFMQCLYKLQKTPLVNLYFIISI